MWLDLAIHSHGFGLVGLIYVKLTDSDCLGKHMYDFHTVSECLVSCCVTVTQFRSVWLYLVWHSHSFGLFGLFLCAFHTDVECLAGF